MQIATGSPLGMQAGDNHPSNKGMSETSEWTQIRSFYFLNRDLETDLETLRCQGIVSDDSGVTDAKRGFINQPSSAF